MSWDTFWLPNIIQATLFAALAAIVGLLVRRWIGGLRPVLEQILGWQQRGFEAAESAEKHSAAAAQSSAVAEKHAATALEEARETKRAALELKDSTGRVIQWLPEGDEAVEYLKETNSRLVAQLVIQAKRHPEDFEAPPVPLFRPPEDPDAPITTGKHRLISPETMRLQALRTGESPTQTP